MRVLIIGGTGLISTAITRALIARGDAVTLYNRGQTEADIPAGYATITGNRKDYVAFETQMAGSGSFDAVIDMVGFVPADIESAIRAFRGNIGQFIFCSTVDVYTKPARHYPIHEDAEREPMPSLFTTKSLRNGGISVRKRLFSERLTGQGCKRSAQSFFFWGETLENFLSRDNIDLFFSNNDTIQFAGRRC